MTMNMFLRTFQPKVNSFLQHNSICFQPKRSIARWLAPVRRVMYRRKKALENSLKPKPIFRRSAFIDWNYRAELFAFGARLNEKFKEETLKVAFTHQSYIEKEVKQRESLNLPETSIDLKANQFLINHGEVILKDYIKPFLRIGYQFLPEEGITALENYLLSTNVLAHVATNLGVKELLLSADYPPEQPTLANTFKAIVGALATDTSSDQAELFVQDFLITQLIGKNIIDLWPIVNPMGIVVDILEREGRGPPEARLIRESGRNTILAVFQVGIYSDKMLIGS
uniref:Large ribosomal subunit protein mL44 n=1 Tax=Strigamia maritima TaxID=126957 RepID=T1ITY2_STRMM